MKTVMCFHSVCRPFKKGIPGLIIQVLCNKPFALILLSEYLLVLMMCGILMNGPRYLEVHFLTSAYKANIIAGECGLRASCHLINMCLFVCLFWSLDQG